MKKILHHLFLLITCSACITLTGCFKNFHTVKTSPGFDKLESITESEHKQIIMHYADETVSLKSAEINAEQITGKIASYFPSKSEYKEPVPEKRLHAYKFKHRKTLFNEVHVYANIPRPETHNAIVQKDQVIKYNIYKPARGASIGSHVLGVVLIAATIGLAVSAAVSATEMMFSMGVF